ncbi:MAG: DUF5110 domain-containing protein [Lachnospiraceae bacterium]|nr:DUF5110 domain-containing protein [Lachnospiraceae bacterium]
MKCSISSIKEGIIRISKHENMPEKYMERYGIIKIPEKEAVDNVEIEENSVILPSGRKLNFTLRPEEDDTLWNDEQEYQLEKFKEFMPWRRNVEGAMENRLENASEDWKDIMDARKSTKKFGISFEIKENEKFYGLGEGNRKRIEHRGSSYQNWPVYQYNEVVIPLVYTQENWGVLILAEDRHFVDIDDHIKGRLTILGNLDELDILILYGDSIKDIIKLYIEVSGKSMLLPKYVYGLTYIAPMYQNQFEILNDMMKYREKHIPVDNVSLEPGWMNNYYDYSFDKDWNLSKFDIHPWMRKREYPSQFLSVMRRFGFHVGLWNCSYYDLCDHEERLVTGVGQLPSWYEHLKKFVNAGVDGFKMDPSDMLIRVDPNKIYTNGKSELEMHNISQVLVLKQMYKGFTEQTGNRPYLHFSGGYTGQQHWGGVTTGDNGGKEGSMIWLLNLAMSGFMNTTVDMDIYSPETIHFAMLAPWAHHNAWEGCRQPWYAGEENERIYTYYARLRYRLLPYIYSAAIECHETGIPMLRPMPMEFQDDNNCLELSNQYMLGEYILLSAFTDKVYLPKGGWIDYWTGEEYESQGETITYTIPKERGGAFFIKKGAIIPQWSDRDYVTQYGEEEIALHIYPNFNEKSTYVFYEDDGISVDYEKNICSQTEISCECVEGKVLVHIGKREGDYQNKPEKRIWKIYVHGFDGNVTVSCAEKTAEVVVILAPHEA